ncbi:unnamed protein product [Cylindrotheca closterium]|uniref:Uncharacterized protein n=1 Tax=Cylindrotheca closterium TaxID=2856 RepID=A0AAD2FWH2_9STRA|nr:unnamed protein product [Cylindrotheca closterium]
MATFPMPPNNNVFVVTAATTYGQVPRNVRFVRVDGSVRVLPDSIFQYCESLKEVSFEEGTHTIGKSAFRHCVLLTKVKLPSTLRAILGGAFSDCFGLTSIDLPLRLHVIGECAFGFANLRHLKIPATVETIGDGAFRECRLLESIILPPRLEVIASNLFHGCSNLKDIEIPRTVKLIQAWAFAYCSALKKLDLFRCTQCLAIGSFAFRSCSALSWITLPPNLKGDFPGIHGCSELRHLRVPPHVTSIGKGTFNPLLGCTSFMSLEFPEGLESIGLRGCDDGFETGVSMTACQSLVNMYLPPLQQVPNEVFDDEVIPEGFQLAKVATNWRDLVTKLKQRFNDRPLHRVCYFHSYHLIEDTIQRIKDILIDNPSACVQTDGFGMTPLHILVLAQKPRLELFQECFTSADLTLLSAKDRFGSTVLDYLFNNTSNDGLKVTGALMKKVVEQRVAYLGLDRWKEELLDLAERIASADRPWRIRNFVNFLLHRLQHFEFLEVLSLLEMVLWRIKLSESENTLDQANTDRESCRVQSGIAIVMENVLPFLPTECRQSEYGSDDGETPDAENSDIDGDNDTYYNEDAV